MKNRIKMFLITLSVCALTMFGFAFAAEVEVDISQGNLVINSTTYTVGSTTQNYTAGSEFVISGSTTTNTIVVAKDVDANITFDGVSIIIPYRGTSTTTDYAFMVEEGSTGDIVITLEDGTENTLSASSYGICFEGEGNLTIEGTTGTLQISSYPYGAALDHADGTLTINGGIINVTGPSSSGRGIYANEIIINNGSVTAEATHGAAIQAQSSLTINGGTVNATGHDIGGMGLYCKEGILTISGGEVVALADNTGAGIYGNTVSISDAKVTSTSGQMYAGITGDVITIDNSVVVATGGPAGAGIGGGSSPCDVSSISIKGSVVTAIAGTNAYSLGAGYSTSTGTLGTTGTIIIENSSVLASTLGNTPTDSAGNTVSLKTISNTNSLPVLVNGKLYPVVNHLAADDADYNLYAWLKSSDTVTTGITGNSVQIDISMGSLLIYEDYYQFGQTIVERDNSNANNFQYIISGATTENNIQVMNNNVYANITLAGTTIDLSACTGDDAKSPIHNYSNNMGDVVITLKSGTTNTLKASEDYAGIRKSGISEEAGSLTIKGTGTLDVYGGVNAAAIGDKSTGSTSNIYITGGTIYAHGGSAQGTAAPGNGIGASTVENIVISGGKINASGGYGGYGIGGSTVNGITISGGAVYATGGSTTGGCAGAIGGSSVANITISGGTVTAIPGQWKGNYATGIGGSFNSNSTVNGVVITGGSIKTMSITNPTNGSVAVSLLKISNPNNKVVTINGKNWTPVNHTALDTSDTYLYAWVPAGSTYVVGTVPKVTGITDGETYYVTQKITVTDDDPKSVVIGGVNNNQITSPQSFDVTGNVDKTYTITVTDESGNVVEYTIEMLPISTIAIPIEDLTVDNVTEDDRDTILDVLAAAEDIDLTHATDDEKAEVQEIIDKCNELLDALNNYQISSSIFCKASYQAYLIEPWAMRVTVRFTDANGTTIDVADMQDYGAYAIRAGELDDLTDVTIGDIINNSAATKVTKSSVEGTGMWATGDGKATFGFDDGLFTYRMSEEVYWVAYCVDANGNTHYMAYKTKSLHAIAETLVASTTTNSYIKAILEDMLYMEEAIIDYRSDFDNLTDLEPSNPSTVQNCGINFGLASTDGKYAIGNSYRVSLIEPWSVRLIARIYDTTDSDTSSTDHIDYSAADDYGVIVFQDIDGTHGDMSNYADLLAIKDAYVYSKSQGNMEIDTDDATKVSAGYDKDIFTYQLDKDIYCVSFVKIDGKFYYSKLLTRNIHTYMSDSITNNSGTDKLLKVYDAMIEMYESVKAYHESL